MRISVLNKCEKGGNFVSVSHVLENGNKGYFLDQTPDHPSRNLEKGYFPQAIISSRQTNNYNLSFILQA